MSEEIIKKANGIFIRTGYGKGIAAIKEIEKRLAMPAFNVCVAGGFSRGKSHLINQLLGAELLPEDVLPSTTVLTEVEYGPEIKICFHGEDNDEVEITKDELGKYCAESERADAAGVIKIQYPAYFLDPAIRIYDTPGMDDLLAPRASVAFAALEQCDAALIATSAIAPLGLHEKQFIETYIFGRELKKIAIVITFLDQLRQEDQQRQARHLAETARELFPGVEVWAPDERLGGNICQAVGVEAMRGRIRAWSKDQALAEQRMARALLELSGIAGELIQEEQAALENLEGDRTATLAKLKEAQAGLREDAETWRNLRSDFMEAGVRRAEDFQKKFSELAMRLNADVENAPENQSGEKLRNQLRQLSHTIMDYLRVSINIDVETLADKIYGTFGYRPILAMPVIDDPEMPEEGIVVPENYGGADAYELLAGFVDGILDKVIMFLPLPRPYVGVARIILKKLVSAGRKSLGAGASGKKQITGAISAFFGATEIYLRENINDIYNQIAAQMRNEQARWIEGQKAMLDKKYSPEELALLIREKRDMIAQAEELRREISAKGAANARR